MKDQISALMDDELDVEDSDHLFDAMKKNSDLYACWSTYHVIGDALRGEHHVSMGFEQRLMQRLDAEPVVLAPKRRLAVKRTHVMSLAASVAAVMFVGWMVLQQQAQSPAQSLGAATVAQNSVSPEAVNSYLLAHQEFSPESGFRPVIYSESDR